MSRRSDAVQGCGVVPASNQSGGTGPRQAANKYRDDPDYDGHADSAAGYEFYNQLRREELLRGRG